ncbi:MAG: hypothetical protein B6I34_01915 [Anaerolineaceae bacterium 4572_32.1]|nr:MAG: hypothetical protein B6I34_01915 [Anaerolineaceae bacterium 4572_32.1]
MGANIYESLEKMSSAGETVALATIVGVRGSVPREVGTKMIVHPEGRHAGTVGGGCGEHEVILAGLDVIRSGEPEIVRVDLTGDAGTESLGACGGVMDVFVERWTPDEVLPELLRALDEQRPAALLTVVRAEGSLAGALGRRAVIWELGQHAELRGDLALGDLEAEAIETAWDALAARRSKLVALEAAEGRAELFVEVQHRPPTLLIVGAGHIALPLAQLGKMCDFKVAVLDDRASFANEERFPTADRVIAAPFEETLREFPLHEDSYIVLVTRGHQHDVSCLLEVLDRPSAYIGMIGSRRRIRAVFQLLEEEKGIRREKFERLHAPIGLDIGSQTPAEIAISIMAEIIQVRRG